MTQFNWPGSAMFHTASLSIWRMGTIRASPACMHIVFEEGFP